MGNRINLFKYFKKGAGYDPDALLYFAQLTGSLPYSFRQAINTFIITLKADGNWSELDRFWLHATPNQQNARISIVNPSSTPITEVNSPTFTANIGYQGNGINSYLDTNYNARTQGIKYTLNSASFGIYIQNNISQAAAAIGSYDLTGVVAIYPKYTDNNYYASLNTWDGGSLTPFPAVATSKGLSAIKKNLLDFRTFRNGVDLIGAQTSNITVVPNVNNYVCGLNFNNTLSPSTHQCSLSFFGSGAINQTTFYAAIQTLATTLGFNV